MDMRTTTLNLDINHYSCHQPSLWHFGGLQWLHSALLWHLWTPLSPDTLHTQHGLGALSVVHAIPHPCTPHFCCVPGASAPLYTALLPPMQTISPEPSITALDRCPSFQLATKTNFQCAAPSQLPQVETQTSHFNQPVFTRQQHVGWKTSPMFVRPSS